MYFAFLMSLGEGGEGSSSGKKQKEAFAVFDVIDFEFLPCLHKKDKSIVVALQMEDNAAATRRREGLFRQKNKVRRRFRQVHFLMDNISQPFKNTRAHKARPFF